MRDQATIGVPLIRVDLLVPQYRRKDAIRSPGVGR
jgi:hypothetical protein